MIEIARIDCAWPTDKGAHLDSKLLARDCGVRWDLAPIWPGSWAASARGTLPAGCRGNNRTAGSLQNAL